MSVTTTEDETVYRSARNVLADYELHYTRSVQASDDTAAASAPNQRTASAAAANPAGWPTDYRRVPPHRPIDHQLDPAERYVFLNNGERVFVNIMLMGVRINSTANTIWRATGGRLNDRIFRYAIGAEC